MRENNKAFQFRIYPTAEQEELFAKTFGCCRFIYNRMLSDKIEEYKKTGKMLKITPAAYKKEFPQTDSGRVSDEGCDSHKTTFREVLCQYTF